MPSLSTVEEQIENCSNLLACGKSERYRMSKSSKYSPEPVHVSIFYPSVKTLIEWRIKMEITSRYSLGRILIYTTYKFPLFRRSYAQYRHGLVRPTLWTVERILHKYFCWRKRKHIRYRKTILAWGVTERE